MSLKSLVNRRTVEGGGAKILLDPAPTPNIKIEDGQVAVVVPVHNSPRTVRACLRSVHKHTRKNVTLVVVDDASNEYTAQMLKDELDAMGGRPTSLHRFDKNQKYTRAINQGFKIGFLNAKHCVALNSDTLVTPLWLERILKVTEDPTVGVVCPYMSNAALITIDMPPGASYLDTAERIAARVAKYGTAAPYAVTPVGACMLVTKKHWDKHGPFDVDVSPKGAGGYGEECWFWALEPEACRVAPDAYVYHEGGASYGKAKRKAEEDAVKIFLGTHKGLLNAWRDKTKRRDPRARIQRELPGIRIRSMEKPRIAFITGGIELCGGILALTNICNRLNEQGIQATIGYKHERGNEWHRMPCKFSPVKYSNASEWTKSGGFEAGIVLATAWYTGQMVQDLAASNTNLVAHAFIQDREDMFRRPGGKMEYDRPAKFAPYLQIVRSAGAVVNSNWVLQSMVRDLDIPSEKLDYIPIGIDSDLFYDRGLRTGNGPIRILSFSRPETPRRGHKILVEVYKRLRAKYGKQIELVVYDRHPGAECPIDLYLGRISQKELAIEMASSHILIEPSYSQGWGLPGQEMMASGGVLVSTDNGGIRNYGTHEQDCLIAENADPETLFEQTCRAVENPEMRQALGKAARARVLRLTWDRIADAWAEWTRRRCRLW